MTVPTTSVDDVVAVLSDLVGFPTESLTPNRGLIDWLSDHLQTFGARVVAIEGPAGRSNLLASLGPAGPGGLMLSAHTDVVPAGPGWTTDPYDLTRFEHPTFGEALRARGSADMKGFIACALIAVRELDIATLKRPVHLAFSYDEEVGCVGVRGLLDHLVDEVRNTSGVAAVSPDLVLIGEPSMMWPRHAHLGKVAYRLTFRATPGHSSLSPFLPTAIGGATRTITVLESIAEAHRATAVRDANGEAIANVSVNVGTIHGGTALNVLSEQCELTFELRHSTAFDPDALLAPLWASVDAERVRSGHRVDVVEIARYPALSTDASADVVRLIERIADRGKSIPIGYGTEGGLFAAALGVPVIICGPGDIAVAHRADEYVSLDQLRSCLTFLRQFIAAVCCP